MSYKLKDGDILKILPIFMKNGNIEPIIKYTSMFLESTYITDGGDLLNRISRKFYTRDLRLFKDGLGNLSKKYFISAYINSKIEYISIGRSLYNIISENYKFNPRNDLHLKINLYMVQGYEAYDKSSIVNIPWDKPIADVDNSESWKTWIIENQPGFIEDKFNIHKHIDLLNKNFDNCVSSFIQEDRNEKLESIGI